MKRMSKVLAAIDAILDLSLGGIGADELKARVMRRVRCNEHEYHHAALDLSASGMIRATGSGDSLRVVRIA